ncbi:hypothetical protein O4J56_14080 [Nocardiopsis sp. RSe5-2]|uniref:Uncharacterized protein n=1 Tax=Nocardiopsis endophytica TaxID=3018445 RepID=A0ABT4U487_9ACTN|nr:hypothetical protein [Nocardiopsis endophytica]MDA2811766.1 hypothetical protein [Nocardiopsis endophytica]
MIDEFRAAFQELIDASVASDTERFPEAVHRVYNLAHHVPAEERELALEALGTLLSGGHTGPGITADLCVVAGALVESGAIPGETGTTVVRLLRTMGQGAAVFLHAWNAAGAGEVPDPDEVTAQAEQTVAEELGETAATATICWWTIRRHALAAATMLADHRVRAAVRGDTALGAELIAISNQLSARLEEFAEMRALLRMTGATSALVLDRATGRGFRVFFEGIGDNFQLHTLLADALVGEEGQGLPGHRPDERWTAAFRDTEPDPAAGPVKGWWNLVALDGSWVWNEGVPADIPTHDGEHVLVLDAQPYPRSWNARRRHPQVTGWLEVDTELGPEETEQWWARAAPPTDTASGTFSAFERPAAAAAAAAPAPQQPGPDADQEEPGPPAAGTATGPAPGEAHEPAGEADEGTGLPTPSAPAFDAEPAAPGQDGAGEDAEHAGEPAFSAAAGEGPDADPGPWPSAEATLPGTGPIESGLGPWPGYGQDAQEPPAAPEWDRAPAPVPVPSLSGPAPVHEDGGEESSEVSAAPDGPGDADAAQDGSGPEGEAAEAPAPEPADAPEPQVAATEQIPVLTEEMLRAYDEERAAQAEEEPEQGPPGKRILPPLPPGVSKRSGWGPTWR